MRNNYDLFCQQAISALRDFPSLNVVEKNGIRILKGILDIPNAKSEVTGSFLIEVHFSKGFPYRFPTLYEIGGDIKNEADWHKYSDQSCCITVPPDEILRCKHGITVKEFLAKYCISFFANHLYRLSKGEYLNGEYSHDGAWVNQFYSELFKTSDMNKWIEYISHVFQKKSLPSQRNSRCFCGSKIKYKYCHLKVFENVAAIGYNQIKIDLKLN